MKALVFTVATLLTACATSQDEWTSEPITKIESRTLRSDIVTHQVFDQLADALTFDQPTNVRPEPPRLALADAWFYTRPRADPNRPLCVVDEVVVRFEPASADDLGADTPVRAASVEASPRFHFVAAPSDPRQPLDNAVCAALSPIGDETFFSASSSDQAWNAALLLELVAGRVREAELTFEIECSGRRLDCNAVLSEASYAQITDVRACARPDPHVGYCYIMTLGGDVSVAIEAQNVLRPGERPRWVIEKVWVSELIVLWHERPD
jgi:hypothetical protein